MKVTTPRKFILAPSPMPPTFEFVASGLHGPPLLDSVEKFADNCNSDSGSLANCGTEYHVLADGPYPTIEMSPHRIVGILGDKFLFFA